MIILPDMDNELLRSIEKKFIIDQEPSGQLVPIENLLKIQKQKNKLLDTIDEMKFNSKLTSEYVDGLNSEQRKLFSDYGRFRAETHIFIADLNDQLINQRNNKYFWMGISAILAATFFVVSILI